MSDPHPRPRLLGPYQLLRTLGKGGYSKVKMALDPIHNRRVAVKVIKESLLRAAPEDTQLQVEREIAIMSQVEHPHVVRLLDAQMKVQYPRKRGEPYDALVLVMELCEAGSLFDVLKHTGAMDERVARTYFYQLVDAVGYCHAQGVCHRDLKPENVFLTADYSLRVGDFGLSRLFIDGQGRRRHMLTDSGTPIYSAPEVLVGRQLPYDGELADVFSLGVVLFTMLTVAVPFSLQQRRDPYFKLLADDDVKGFWAMHGERVAHISEELRAFIARMLTVDVAARITLPALRQEPWYTGHNAPALLTPKELEKAMEGTAERVVAGARRAEEEQRQQREQQHRTAAAMVAPRAPLVALTDDPAYRSPPTMPAPAQQAAAAYPAPVRFFFAAPPAPARAMAPAPAPAFASAPPKGPSRGLASMAASMSGPRMESYTTAIDRKAANGEKANAPHAVPVPVYDPRLALPTFMAQLFATSLSLTALRQALMAAFSAHGLTVVQREAEHRYKASKGPEGDKVILVAQVWQKQEAEENGLNEGQYLVEFRRHFGDSAQYHTLLSALRTQMGDVLTVR